MLPGSRERLLIKPLARGVQVAVVRDQVGGWHQAMASLTYCLARPKQRDGTLDLTARLGYTRQRRQRQGNIGFAVQRTNEVQALPIESFCLVIIAQLSGHVSKIAECYRSM